MKKILFIDRKAIGADLRELPRVDLEAFWVVMRKAINHPRPGQGLTNKASFADLSDCRSIYFGSTDEADVGGWRCVFRLLPSEASAEYLQIVAVGPRNRRRTGEKGVYGRAEERLAGVRRLQTHRAREAA